MPDNPFDENLLVNQGEAARDLAPGNWQSLRPLGWGAVISGVLWVFGFGSLFAIGFGLIGIVGRYEVITDEYPPPGLRMCQAGVVLGVVGLIAALVLYL